MTDKKISSAVLEKVRGYVISILVEKKRMAKSFLYFINNYCYIEGSASDKSEGGGYLIPFKLWDGQTLFAKLLLEFRLLIMLKTRQMGATWLTLCYALWRMMTIPGYRVGCLSKRELEASELVRRVTFVLHHMPKWLVRHKNDYVPGYTGLLWDSTELQITINFYDKPGDKIGKMREYASSTLMAFPSAPDSMRTYVFDLVIFDEWAFHPFAREIWASAFPIIHKPNGGQFIGISTGLPGTLFEEIYWKAKAGESSFKSCFLDWTTDPRRTQEYYEEAIASGGSEVRREYPKSEHEAFSAGSGMAFEVWDEKIHANILETWYPPDTGRIIRVYDPGYTRACCKWYWINEINAVCYREFYPKQMTDVMQIEEILRLSVKPDGEPEKIYMTLVDPIKTFMRHGDTGVSTADRFTEKRVPIISGAKSREQGWRRLREWLYPYKDENSGETTARLTFTKACYNTIRTYPMLRVKQDNPEDVDEGEDHPQDCDRMLVMSRADFKGKVLQVKDDIIDDENWILAKIKKYKIEKKDEEERRIWSRE